MRKTSGLIAGLTATVLLCAGLSNAQDYRPPVAKFDAKSSVSFPPHPALEIGRYGTIEFWVKPGWTTQPDYDPVLLSYLGKAGPLYAVVMTRDGQAIGLLSGQDWDVTQFDFTDGKMHHVAFVILREVTEVYVDGKHEDTLLVDITDGEGRSFHIGSIDGIGSRFTGSLAGLRVWNTPLDGDTLNAFKLLNVKPAGSPSPHPDIDALVGESWFEQGAHGFNLTYPVVSLPSAGAVAGTNTKTPAKETP